MELQISKYSNLVKSLSYKMKVNGYYSKEDFEQELWLKLYEFIKKNSGEADNFPLIKSALRNHLLYLIRHLVHNKEASSKKEVYSIEDLVLCGVELIYDGFGPYEKAESGEVVAFINEWFQQQNDRVQKFIIECLLEMNSNKVPIHRAKKNLSMHHRECDRIIFSLKEFLEKKGVTYVS
jgi:DNA-directed RNA polymerase specialized sigma subunit